MRKYLTIFSVLAVMALPADLMAKHPHGKKWKNKDNREWRRDTERESRYRDYNYDRESRYRDYNYDRGSANSNEWRHRSSTHPPHDANGDGVVTRREWPGNNTSFRQLDRNGDGVLSEADRRFQRSQRYYR